MRDRKVALSRSMSAVLMIPERPWALVLTTIYSRAEHSCATWAEIFLPGVQNIFCEADEDFPASATCLFSSNADEFLPIDGLADLGEYTSRAILGVVG